ncbi:hypothetical protein LEM8419_00432 [Neolewinella maritima]|uniref:Peptidase M56 domain-containing protein n=1 Tax=Neolewinella maritima TaxID=1383882 RepID=A0ABM9AXH2_9BACT|nr:M56 family metallopeptidase [Neolewinella maritima]CAH0999136.1 hypothetical protein LEM8419_00432 [Neolewinella maritima]
MSAAVLSYLLEVTLAWVLLLAFYAIAFRNNANWPAQRYYLLGSWLFGLLLPLLPNVQTVGSIGIDQLPAQVATYVVPVLSDRTPVYADSTLHWSEWMALVWLIGAAVRSVTAGWLLAQHLPRYSSGWPDTVGWFEGYRVVRSVQVASPYAAFRTIYLPASLAQNLEYSALLHEAAHLQRGHHFEQLILLLGTVLFWFHPLIWCYAHQLAAVHEYEADAAVVESVDPRLYGKQLLRATLAPRLVPALFSSPLKRRIMLLTKKDMSHAVGAARWSVLLLLLTGLFVACHTEQEFDEQAWIAEHDARLTSYPPRLDAAFSSGKMWHTLLDTIYQRVNYPEAASAAGQYGHVLLRLDVDETGRVTHYEVPAPQRAADVVSNDLPVHIVTHSKAPDRKALPFNQPNTPLTQEVARMAEHLSSLQFHPATVDGVPTRESLYLNFTFTLE